MIVNSYRVFSMVHTYQDTGPGAADETGPDDKDPGLLRVIGCQVGHAGVGAVNLERSRWGYRLPPCRWSPPGRFLWPACQTAGRSFLIAQLACLC
jgi:hypothetical protein